MGDLGLSLFGFSGGSSSFLVIEGDLVLVGEGVLSSPFSLGDL